MFICKVSSGEDHRHDLSHVDALLVPSATADPGIKPIVAHEEGITTSLLQLRSWCLVKVITEHDRAVNIGCHWKTNMIRFVKVYKNIPKPTKKEIFLWY